MAIIVGGFKSVLAQPNTMACWATVYTMMVSWKKQQSFDIATAVRSVGPKYLKYYLANTGLPPSEFGPFLRAAGMNHQPMVNLAVSEWERLLQFHGLLWVGTLATTAPNSGLHSRIIEQIIGKGTLSGIRLGIIDPAGGRRYNESFSDFLKKYEGGIRATSAEYYQIRYFV